VALNGVTAAYDWSTQVAGLPGEVTYTGAGLHGNRVPDNAGRLDTITWGVNNAIISSTDYELDNMGRRTKAAREDGTHWDYGYDAKGEVIAAAQKTNANNTALPGR
jgi:hypothetical protein